MSVQISCDEPLDGKHNMRLVAASDYGWIQVYMELEVISMCKRPAMIAAYSPSLT